MKVAHVSDTDTLFPTLPAEAELVVHSGDLFPDLLSSSISKKQNFQLNWLKRKAEDFKLWLDGRPLLFTSGNHDWISPVETLSQAGIQAYEITNRTLEFAGHIWYGFPYIPFIYGDWNFETTSDQMGQEIDKLAKIILEKEVDILVSHAPIANILDEFNGNHYGITQMANMFNYILPQDKWPKAYLCGHIHDFGGKIINHENMIISNAATKVNLLEL